MNLGEKIYTSEIVREIFAFYLICWMSLTLKFPLGKTVYDSDWDALIVLDACRYDALQEVAPEYGFLDSEQIDSVYSVGSTSKEWILKTFTEEYSEEISNTTYISGNSFSHWFTNRPVDHTSYAETVDTHIANMDVFESLFSESLVGTTDFHHVDDLSPLGDLDNPGYTPYAEDITDHAIKRGRELNHDRMIVHYMQPHSPYISAAGKDKSMTDRERNPSQALREGAPVDEIYDLYLDNLRYVLDNVGVLLNNLDADSIIITADHGELFGELGQYGHAAGIPHPAVRKVPWATTTASDNKEYMPDPVPVPDNSQDSIEKRLENLGYR
jgi:hypothetical protein